MTPTERSHAIEALLFSEGGALSVKKLASLLECSEADIVESVEHLSRALDGRGITLLVTGNDVALVTAPACHEVVAKARTRDAEREIGDAGLEVIAILLYEGPSTRATVDYIRGVNSSSTMRTLLARGMIDRSETGREYLYATTPELLAHLGVTNTKALPDFEKLSHELATFRASAPTHDVIS